LLTEKNNQHIEKRDIMSVLDRVNSPKDLKKLNDNELEELCSDIRELLINTVSKTGGHLASNLGVNRCYA